MGLQINRHRIQQCVADRITEFADREKPEGSPGGRPAYCRNIPQKRGQAAARAPADLRNIERAITGGRRTQTSTDALRKEAKQEQAGPEKRGAPKQSETG